MTCDIWLGVNILSKFQLPSSYGFDRQCLEDSEQKDHLINELFNYKGVYRTARATPVLLNILGILGSTSKVLKILYYEDIQSLDV